jgi:hypothetical protein
MANVYKSSAVLKNSRARPDSQYEAEEATFSITLPQGTVLGIGDTLVFGILGENLTAQQFSLDAPAIDTNATATLAGRFGIVQYAGPGNAQTYTGSNDAVFIAAATVLQNNTTGAKNFARLDGETSAGDTFAVTPYPVQTTQQLLVLNISAVAATNNLANGPQTVNLSIKYQYAYPDTFVSGVTGVTSTNLKGNPVSSQAVVYQYNNQAP